MPRRRLTPLQGPRIEECEPLRPQDTTPYIPLLRAPVHGELLFFSLSPALHWFPLHYDPEIDRTIPCAGKPACDYCANGSKPTRTPFLCALTRGRRSRGVVQVTGTAILHATLPVRTAGFRGLELAIGRLRPNKRGPVYLRATGQTREPDQCPAEFDLRRALYRVWGYVERDDHGRDGNPPSFVV